MTIIYDFVMQIKDILGVIRILKIGIYYQEILRTQLLTFLPAAHPHPVCKTMIYVPAQYDILQCNHVKKQTHEWSFCLHTQ